MPRKLEISLRDWVPFIIRCYYEREPFDLFETVKSIGRLRVDIGDAQQQVDEIKKVFEYLVSNGFISPTGPANNAYYWGISFSNQAYKIEPRFSELVGFAMQPQATQDQVQNHIVFNTTVNNKNSFINIEKLIEKIAEFKASIL